MTDTPTDDLREVVARAIADANGSPHIEDWRLDADAALSALTPHIAAREAAAFEAGRAAERAEVVAWLRWPVHTGSYKASIVADAIERNEHRSKP